MAFVGFLAVVVPGLSMAITGVMSTLSGGLSLANATTAHYAALFAQQGDAWRRWGPVCRWPCVGIDHRFVGLLAAWLVVVQRIKGRALLMRCR
jgi:iron(III) transport system permease protein